MDQTQKQQLVRWLVVLLVLWMVFGRGCDVVSVVKPAAATYVYEKDDTAVPAAVHAAIHTLNQQGIVATLFEDDIVDGAGETPEQYKVPLAAAREAGLPALVVTGGGKVIRVVKDPRTEQDVMEAVR